MELCLNQKYNVRKEHKGDFKLSQSAPSYGGQAVLEGVVMRGPKYATLCARTPDGQIVEFIKKSPSPGERKPLLRLPIIRGTFAFCDSLILGMEMLFKSAEISAPEEMEGGKAAINLAAILAAVIAVGLFIMLPAFLAPFVAKFLNVQGRALTTLVETSVRMVILVLYVLAVSRMQEIQRVLEYHGAEHKVLWAFEHNYFGIEHKIDKEKWGKEELSKFLALRASQESRLHPRCGTSFLFISVLCTWVIIFLFSPTSFLPRVLFRLIMLPLVAGLSYEILKMSGGKDSLFWKMVRAPGLLLQSLTTREPDASQLEVAAQSLTLLIEAERGGTL